MNFQKIKILLLFYSVLGQITNTKYFQEFTIVSKDVAILRYHSWIYTFVMYT